MNLIEGLMIASFSRHHHYKENGDQNYLGIERTNFKNIQQSWKTSGYDMKTWKHPQFMAIIHYYSPMMGNVVGAHLLVVSTGTSPYDWEANALNSNDTNKKRHEKKTTTWYRVNGWYEGNLY